MVHERAPVQQESRPREDPAVADVLPGSLGPAGLVRRPPGGQGPAGAGPVDGVEGVPAGLLPVGEDAVRVRGADAPARDDERMHAYLTSSCSYLGYLDRSR